jgi:fibronectin type 3 domain-containing protein/predicted small lipoprotein YifL
MKKVCIMSIIVLLLTGCGRRGPLVSPEALAPAPIADLRLEQQGGQFLVSWTRPGGEVGGGALKDLAVFQIFKREVLPPGEDCEECPTAYRLMKSIDLEYPQGVIVLGNSYVYMDNDLAEGKTYRYKAYSVKKDGTMSRTSNRAGRKKVAPPLPPVLKVASSLSGVVLEWGGATPSANGRIEGYNIYRKQNGETIYHSPLNGTPVREATFEDKRVEWGKQYDYTVRTVALVDGETVESVPSNEVRGALAEPE